MKQTLAFLLAIVMVMTSVLTVITSATDTSVAEPETTEPVIEDFNLFGGVAITNNMAFVSGNNASTYGQIFTVPAGKLAVNLTIGFSVPDASWGGAGTLRIWAWDTDYTTTTGATPLYTEEFTAANMKYTTFTFDSELSGELFWEVECGNKTRNTPRVLAASETLEGVINVMNGNLNASCAGVTNGAQGTGTDGNTYYCNSIGAVVGVIADPDYVPPVETESSEPESESDSEPADETTTEPADETTEPADETTEPADETTEPDTTAADTTAAAEGGCGSVVGSAVAVAVIAIAGAAVVLKKKED
ncbi:MAG: hypothetical protein IJX74_02995 [Clostridia bacterium]|nr:hypothetical protein [Clostridia bacterium]